MYEKINQIISKYNYVELDKVIGDETFFTIVFYGISIPFTMIKEIIDELAPKYTHKGGEVLNGKVLCSFKRN